MRNKLYFYIKSADIRKSQQKVIAIMLEHTHTITY